MSNKTKSTLEEINKKSRQLLSKIIELQKYNAVTPDNSASSPETVTEITIAELVNQREQLIYSLFQETAPEGIESEITLVNEMVSLDHELSNEFSQSKLALSDQVIKIKNSKKIKKSYQKY